MQLIFRILLYGLIIIFCVTDYTHATPRKNFHGNLVFSDPHISISVAPRKASLGDTVRITIETKEDVSVGASILVPDSGTFDLKLVHVKPSLYISNIVIGEQYPQGIYAVQVWMGNRKNPVAIRKAAFLYGKIIADFCSMGVFDSEHPGADMISYLNEIGGFRANFLIASGIITSNSVYCNLKVCNPENSSSRKCGYLDSLLMYADEKGYSVMLPATWDMTAHIPYSERENNIKEITRELYVNYSRHPSFVGFYIEQEGSGIYYAPFVRDLCDYVKSIDSGLLTACAPYVDNPVLASYLSAIKSLDVIIYQGMVMASYRPDNRLKFPLRRVKDFCSLAVGAKQLQNKIALTHVETFGYEEASLKNLFLTGYDNIYQQFLSAATVSDNDGIIMFDYSAIIYNTLRKYHEYRTELVQSRDAVFDGMKAFELIGRASKKPNQIAIYLPYTDWQGYRWACYYYDALDAFRIMGIPVDILPYAPPEDEAYPPYWPYHENSDVLNRLLKVKEVLVLPNISGLQETDSELIKHFLEEGGKIVAFGPEIPMGRTYDRTILFGIKKTKKTAFHTEVVGETEVKNGTADNRLWKIGRVGVPVWRDAGARVIARFEDGSPFITLNKYGKGEALSILIDAKAAAEKLPILVRQVLDMIVGHQFVDIIGTNQDCDIADSRTDSGFVVAVVNHNGSGREITLRPLITSGPRSVQRWIDGASGKEIARLRNNEPLRIRIGPGSFRVVEMRADRGN